MYPNKTSKNKGNTNSFVILKYVIADETAKNYKLIKKRILKLDKSKLNPKLSSSKLSELLKNCSSKTPNPHSTNHSNSGETAKKISQNRSGNFATVNENERSSEKQILLNLISDDTILVKSYKQDENENNSFSSQSKVINDIGDIHEFYQNRVVNDYK